MSTSREGSSNRPIVPSLNISRQSGATHAPEKTEENPKPIAAQYSARPTPRYSPRASYSYVSNSTTPRASPQKQDAAVVKFAKLIYSLRYPIIFVSVAYGGVPLHKLCLKYAHYYTYREHDDIEGYYEEPGEKGGVSMKDVTTGGGPDGEAEGAVTATAAWAREATSRVSSPTLAAVTAVLRAFGIPTFAEIRKRQIQKNTEGGQQTPRGDSNAGASEGDASEAPIVSVPIGLLVPIVAIGALAAARFLLVKPAGRRYGWGAPVVDAGYQYDSHADGHIDETGYDGATGGDDGQGGLGGTNPGDRGAADNDGPNAAPNADSFDDVSAEKDRINASLSGLGDRQHAGESGKLPDDAPLPSDAPPATAPITGRKLDLDDDRKEQSPDVPARATPSSKSSSMSTADILKALKRNADAKRDVDGGSNASLGPRTATAGSSTAVSSAAGYAPKLGGSAAPASTDEAVVMLALPVPSSIDDVVALLREAQKHKIRRVVIPNVHNHFKFAAGDEAQRLDAYPAIISIPQGVQVEEVDNVRQYCIAAREIIPSIGVHRDVSSPVVAGGAMDASTGSAGTSSTSGVQRAASFFQGTSRYTGLQWFSHPFNAIYVFDTQKVVDGGRYDFDGDESLASLGMLSPSATLGSSKNISNGPLPWCDYHVFLDNGTPTSGNVPPFGSPISSVSSTTSFGIANQPLNFIINLVLYHRTVKPPRRTTSGQGFAPTRHSPMKKANWKAVDAN